MTRFAFANFWQLSKRAIEWNEEKRAAYILAVCEETPDRLVFADETALNCIDTFHRQGWAPQGQRAFKQSNFVRGDR